VCDEREKEGVVAPHFHSGFARVVVVEEKNLGMRERWRSRKLSTHDGLFCSTTVSHA
jgi:hypothetical protein